MGFWDQSDAKPTAAAYMKFDAIGDSVSGVITKLDIRTFNAGSPDERKAVEITFADAPTVTAGQVKLQQALYELRPEPGDHLTITLADIERRAGKTLKHWSVSITRADGSTDEVAQSAA